MIRLLCGDDRLEVALRESRDGLQVTVNGTVFALEVEEIAPGTFLLRQDGRHEVFHCVRDGDDVHLFWRGTAYRLREAGEGGPASHRQVGGLEAPMPGKVIKVNVAPGQRVGRGQEILVIEAMKMENAIRAPRDGRVKSVAAKVGDMVSPGVVLVEIE